MGSGRTKMRLFLIFFTCFYWSASPSPSPPRRGLFSDSMQEQNMGVTRMHEKSTNSIDQDGSCNGRINIARSIKYAHGGGAESAHGSGAEGAHGSGAEGAQGGGSSQTAENGNGGSSLPGGTAAIPVIVAGAANNNRNHNGHHSAASRNRNCIGLPILIMTTLATLTVHEYVAFACQI